MTVQHGGVTLGDLPRVVQDDDLRRARHREGEGDLKTWHGVPANQALGFQ